ncbi:ABC transporter substrate-binding protein [Brachybacterium sp. AOP43-C2-M15]|uniref:ABC transporter substrate-binding protein n=1 Tax=Brachybacterium sp. AOP43-C2-M15 TaxID=3457661 RepID=UPI00403348A3
MIPLRRRTVLQASAAIAGAPLLLTACGGSGPEEDDGGDLVLWFPGTNPAEQTFIDDVVIPAFTEATGRGAAATYIDWPDMSTRLNAGFSSGTGPDLYGHGPAAVADLVGFDRVEPLDGYLEQMDEEDIADLRTGLDSGMVDDVSYLFPIASTGRQVGYNAAHFEEAGLDPDTPPTTFEELKEAADALAVRDGSRLTRAGIVFDTQPAGMQQAFTTMLWANGGELLSEDGTEVLFNGPEGVEALAWYVSLYQGDAPVDSGLGGTWDGLPPAQSPLVTEDTSMLFADSSTFQQIMSAAPDMDLRFMDVLAFEGSEPAAFGGAATGLMINPDSAKKDAAWEFITLIGGAELNNRFAEEVGHVPARESAIESDYVQESPAIATTVENSEHFRSNPNVPGWTRIRDTLAGHLEQALNAQLSPQVALDGAAVEVGAILAEHGGARRPISPPPPRGPRAAEATPPSAAGRGRDAAVPSTRRAPAPGCSWWRRRFSTSSCSSWPRWSTASC